MKMYKLYKILALILFLLILSPNIIANPVFNYQNYPQQNIITIKNIEEETNANSDGLYDLLIIAPHAFSRYIVPLVHHKNKVGVKTILIEVEKVYQQTFWNGRDDAEKIKYFIKTAIENWEIKYVLLVGGRKYQSPIETWWIPVRYSHLDRKYDQFIERKFISDLYFADIFDKNGAFSNWDSNNNGIYGEWPENGAAEDIPDLFPDVYVGRLPCRNIIEVKEIVKKIINYESGRCSDS